MWREPVFMCACRERETHTRAHTRTHTHTRTHAHTHTHTHTQAREHRFAFLDGYFSTVQGLLDWFEVDLGFAKLY